MQFDSNVFDSVIGSSWSEAWPEPLFVLGNQGEIEWCNSAARAIYPSLGEVAEKHIFDLLSANSKQALKSWFSQASGRKAIYLRESVRREARSQELKWTFSVVADGAKVVAIAHDVSLLEQTNQDLLEKLQRIESKFEQISKMSSLGEMTSGIAHEINNPLAVITAKVMSAKMNLGSNSPNLEEVCHSLDIIFETSDRIAKIIRGIKAFARDGSRDVPEVIPFNKVLQDTLALCRNRLQKDQVTLHCPEVDECLLIRCVPVQISQVLLNLIENARDACAQKQEKWIKIGVIDEDAQLRVEVTDSGDGVPASIRAQIMEPFFTTKPVGKGTGLGLSICKTIVENCGGRIWLDPGSQNTRFCVQFPKSLSKS